MARSDVYAQPDAPDPVLSAATVLRLARACLGRADAVTAVDESGGEARVYVVDERVVVKTQRPHRVRARTSLAKEVRLLEYLAGPLAGQIPTVYGYDRVQTAEGTVLHALSADPLVDADLFPTDDNAAALRRRLELGLTDVVDRITSQPGRWTLAVSPDEVASRATNALPTRFDVPAALHSNPGATHTFVDADGGFTGLIDFGDAYLGHPALDLRAWPAVSDRLALREGYVDGQTPPGDFDAVWTVAMVHADMNAIAGRAELAAQASHDLVRRLAHL